MQTNGAFILRQNAAPAASESTVSTDAGTPWTARRKEPMLLEMEGREGGSSGAQIGTFGLKGG